MSTTINLQAIQIVNYGKLEYCYKPIDEIGEKVFNHYRTTKVNDSKFKQDRTTFTKSMLVEVCNMCSILGKDVDFKVSDVKRLVDSQPHNIGDIIIKARKPSEDDALSFL